MGRVDNISQLMQYKQRPEGESKEEDAYREPKKQSQSTYVAGRNFYSTKTIIEGQKAAEKDVNGNLSSTLTNNTWKSVKTNLPQNVISPKDIKDKAALYKSPKYISINKVETAFKANSVHNKIESNEKPL